MPRSAFRVVDLGDGLEKVLLRVNALRYAAEPSVECAPGVHHTLHARAERPRRALHPQLQGGVRLAARLRIDRRRMCDRLPNGSSGTTPTDLIKRSVTRHRTSTMQHSRLDQRPLALSGGAGGSGGPAARPPSGVSCSTIGGALQCGDRFPPPAGGWRRCGASPMGGPRCGPAPAAATLQRVDILSRATSGDPRGESAA